MAESIRSGTWLKLWNCGIIPGLWEFSFIRNFAAGPTGRIRFFGNSSTMRMLHILFQTESKKAEIPTGISAFVCVKNHVGMPLRGLARKAS